MKWLNYTSAFLAATLFASATFAQDAPPEPPAPPKPLKEKREEIIIKKDGGKEEKMTIVVDGDNVTINGKPMNDIKDGNVKIITRKKRMGPGESDFHSFLFPHGEIDNEDMEEAFAPKGVNKAMLGILTTKSENGAIVSEVTKESGAEKAGLKPDDIITKVGDTKVTGPKDLTEAIGKYKPNDKVEITYKRNGKEIKTTATLSENKGKRIMIKRNGEDFDLDMPGGIMPPDMGNFNFYFNNKPRLGLQIQDLEEGKGVKVNDVDNDLPCGKAGLKEGDIITQINGKDISGVDELKEATKDLKEGETIKLTYKRDGKSQTADVKIPKKLKTADL